MPTKTPRRKQSLATRSTTVREEQPVVEELRILFLDIETAPIISHVWGLYDQTVGLNQIQDDWHLLSVAAKWKGKKEVLYMDTSTQKDVSNDKALCQFVYKLLDEADVVVAHNGRRFDVKKLFARFIINGVKPPSQFEIVDTLETARAKFGFTSNKLEYLSDKLCTAKKMTKRKFNGHALWSEIIINKNPEAWKEMRKYNIQDVVALEELYNVFLPWMDRHPNVNLKQTDDVLRCPRCGSAHLHRRGSVTRGVGQYHKYHCPACGKWSQTRTTHTPAKVRKAILK